MAGPFPRVAFALLLGLATAGPALAQTPEKEIAESRRRLEQIREQRTQLGKEITGIRSKVHSLSSEVDLLNRQVSTSAALLRELDVQVEAQQEQVAQTQQDLLDTQDRLTRRKAILHDRLREIYKRGPLNTVEVLLTADSFADLINRYKYLYLIAQRDRQLVQEVVGLEQQLTARQRLLQRRLLELNAAEEERASEHAQLTGRKGERQSALQTAQKREKETASRIASLERDEKRLSGLIATLERKREEAARRAAAAARGTGAARRAVERTTLTTSDLGSLGWPVEGKVLYPFGRQTQANGTVLRWNGIGIAAEAGSAVRAVEAGTVVMAGPFEGYGPTVVLSHGGGYYSLYLYLQSVTVKEGDQVTRNQIVGSVGGEKTPEGTHIEFQIRAPGGQAVDPLAWLKKRAS
jgi:septal ring factor EnvC (AmiA/AmiB activator)